MIDPVLAGDFIRYLSSEYKKTQYISENDEGMYIYPNYGRIKAYHLMSYIKELCLYFKGKQYGTATILEVYTGGECYISYSNKEELILLRNIGYYNA